MSNSSLANIIHISPHKNVNRTHAIDTITIHHTAGVCSAQTIANICANPTRNMSCNYGIGNDGDIALIVEEKDRSWCSSSPSNDHRAITIEVSNSTNGNPKGADGWLVGDKAYNSLVNLCVDICKRNNIKELLWKNDKSLIGQVDKQNMTIHQWFSATACPGDYLLGRLGDVADDVNRRLKGDTNKLYKVQIGAFSKRINAENFMKDIKLTSGLQSFVVEVGNLYKVQVGAFSKKENATSYQKDIKEKHNLDCFVVEV